MVLKFPIDIDDICVILGEKKGFQMSKIIIGFNGWVEADPEHTRFQYIGVREAEMIIITGTEYLQLDEDERDEYILEDLGQAYTHSFDGELDVCDVRVEEDPDHVAQEFLEDLLKDKI